MARCYKNLIMRSVQRHREAISQAPNGLENPRETKAFAIGNQTGKWSITTVQIGNNFAHTLRNPVASRRCKGLKAPGFVPSMKEQDQCQTMAMWFRT